MAKYEVYLQELWDCTYEVKAKTKEEAVDLVLREKGKLIDKCFNHTYDDSIEAHKIND